MSSVRVLIDSGPSIIVYFRSAMSAAEDAQQSVTGCFYIGISSFVSVMLELSLLPQYSNSEAHTSPAISQYFLSNSQSSVDRCRCD
jgi:hypothetical protein